MKSVHRRPDRPVVSHSHNEKAGQVSEGLAGSFKGQ